MTARSSHGPPTRGHKKRERTRRLLIDAAVEVRIGETVISEKGQVLTLTADEAVRAYEGKPLLAKGIVDSIEALLEAEGLGTEFERLSPRAYGELTSRTRLTRSDGKDEAGADADAKAALLEDVISALEKMERGQPGSKALARGAKHAS